MKSCGSSLYKCSISYSTLKRSFAPRIPTTTCGSIVFLFPFSYALSNGSAQENKFIRPETRIELIPPLRIYGELRLEIEGSHVSCWKKYSTMRQQLALHSLNRKHTYSKLKMKKIRANSSSWIGGYLTVNTHNKKIIKTITLPQNNRVASDQTKTTIMFIFSTSRLLCDQCSPLNELFHALDTPDRMHNRQKRQCLKSKAGSS